MKHLVGRYLPTRILSRRKIHCAPTSTAETAWSGVSELWQECEKCIYALLYYFKSGHFSHCLQIPTKNAYLSML